MGQVRLERHPVDVEVVGVGRAGAVFQHVLPPAIAAAGRASCGWARCRGSVPVAATAATRDSDSNSSRVPSSLLMARVIDDVVAAQAAFSRACKSGEAYRSLMPRPAR